MRTRNAWTVRMRLVCRALIGMLTATLEEPYAAHSLVATPDARHVGKHHERENESERQAALRIQA